MHAPATDLPPTEPAPRRARGAPCLWFTRLPLRELVEAIRFHHFAWLAAPLRVQFSEQERLAECDASDDGAPLLLSFHAVLNHGETPPEVFGVLAKRALWPAAARRRTGRRAMPLPFAACCPEEALTVPTRLWR